MIPKRRRRWIHISSVTVCLIGDHRHVFQLLQRLEYPDTYTMRDLFVAVPNIDNLHLMGSVISDEFLRLDSLPTGNFFRPCATYVWNISPYKMLTTEEP